MYVVRTTRARDHPNLAGSTFDGSRSQPRFDRIRSRRSKRSSTAPTTGTPPRPTASRRAAAGPTTCLRPVTRIMSALYIAVTVVMGGTPRPHPKRCRLRRKRNGIVPADVVALAQTCSSSTCCARPRHASGMAAAASAPRPWWALVSASTRRSTSSFHLDMDPVPVSAACGSIKVAGCSLLIGDVPWVAQSLEAYVSKLFALSYSIASLSVASANPADHLVHRHAPRRPRQLAAVAAPTPAQRARLENTICLAVNQASSIQNFGATCESITLGHNPSKLPLSANAPPAAAAASLLLRAHR